jgi:hypothetical protein
MLHLLRKWPGQSRSAAAKVWGLFRTYADLAKGLRKHGHPEQTAGSIRQKLKWGRFRRRPGWLPPRRWGWSMWPWTTPKGASPFRGWAALPIILLLLYGGAQLARTMFAPPAPAVSEKQNAHQPSAERDQRPADEQHQRETWTITREENAHYVAERQTANERERDGAFGTPLTAEEIIALFTIVLTVATIGLIWATWSLGERADKGMRALERPYVGVQLLSHNLVAAFTDDAPIRPWPHVDFIIVNRGKTPAFLIAAMAWLEVDTGEAVGLVRIANADDLMLEGVVLGADDRTRPNHRAEVTSEFGMRGEFNTAQGVWTLVFRGHVAYRDIWGAEYVEEWSARYNALRQRFGWWRRERVTKKG